MIVSDLRRTIRAARKTAGLTQAELAKRARISSVARYAAYEIGYAKLKGEEIDHLIKVLNRAEKERMVPLSNLACAVPTSLNARRGYRVSADLSQNELAVRAGLTQDLISKFELGKANLSPEQAQRWHAAIKAATEEAESKRIVDLATSALCGLSIVASGE